MERAGKTTIFPGEKNACATANVNIVNLVEFYGRLCCVTGNTLQNNSKEHREVKIIYIAAEGT